RAVLAARRSGRRPSCAARSSASPRKTRPHSPHRSSATGSSGESRRLSLKRADAYDFGDIHLVVLIPAPPAGGLRDAMTCVGCPGLERRRVLPPDDGQPLAVFSLERLDVDESGKRTRMFEHLV